MTKKPTVPRKKAAKTRKTVVVKKQPDVVAATPKVASRKLTIMIASTVYNNRDLLLQICGMLNNYGYNVINSEYGTLRPPLGHNNTAACIAAVNDCDIFFGLINPF